MYERAKFFNSVASDPQYKYEQIIDDLDVKNDSFILDYGCGGGYFSYSFSSLVGSEGKVFASDINPEFLSYVESQAKEKKLTNIQTVPVNDLNKRLKNNSLDLIFIRNVTHHISNRLEIFQKLKPYLKDNGMIVIIDYTPEGNRMGHGPPGHYVDPQDLINDMKTSDYSLFDIKEYLLPAQSFSVFKKSS